MSRQSYPIGVSLNNEGTGLSLQVGRLASRLVHGVYTWRMRRRQFDRENLARQGFFSQCGQDKWLVDTLFAGRRNGVFVDIGAHDGLAFSNTLYLERSMGWSGVCVEPNPAVFDKLKQNRHCHVVNACIADHPGQETFQVITGHAEMLSGIKRSYDPAHEARIDRELAAYGGTKREIQVPAVRLTDLLLEQRIEEVDYLNIDVEGAELLVLNSLDLSRIRVNVIGIENNYRDWRIPQRLFKLNYKAHSHVGDEFYVHPDIQKHLSGLRAPS